MRAGALFGAALLLAPACVERGSQPPPAGPAAVGLAAPSAAVLAPGESLTLHPEFQDALGTAITGGAPVFTSQSPKIAEVQPSGHVVAKSTGETVIQATRGQITLRTHLRVAAPGDEITVDVFPADEHQRIKGWEGSGQVGELDCDSTAFRLFSETLIDRLVNELGVNRIRLGARSGIEHPRNFFAEYLAGRLSYPLWRRTWFVAVNDNDDPRVLDASRFQWRDFDYVVESSVVPMRRALAARGERLYVNLNFVDFWLGAGTKAFPHMKHPEEYAELILAIFDHMKAKYGFVPDGVELVLEPENTPYSGHDLGRSLVAASRRLKDAGYDPEFIGPSTTKAANATSHYDALVSVPGARERLDELSYHRYGGLSNAALRAILMRARRDGKTTSMLEHIGSGFDGLYQDLTVAGVSAWEQFALAYCGRRDNPENPGVYYQVNDRDPAHPRINITNEAKLLRQVFRYVRPGAIRVGALTNDRQLRALAFRSSSGGLVVVARAPGPVRFAVRGLHQGTYGVNYSTRAQRYNVDLPDVRVQAGRPLQVRLPANGAITIYRREQPVGPVPP